MGLKLTIFRLDFLAVPSGLKTLFPLIVTFSRNLARLHVLSYWLLASIKLPKEILSPLPVSVVRITWQVIVQLALGLVQEAVRSLSKHLIRTKRNVSSEQISGFITDPNSLGHDILENCFKIGCKVDADIPIWKLSPSPIIFSLGSPTTLCVTIHR